MLKLIFAPFFALLMSFLIALTALPLSAAESNLSPSSRAILSEAKRLSVEGESQKAQAALEAKPRAHVIVAVREGLKEGGDWTGVASQTASALNLTEVVPDLEKAFATSGDWQLVLSISALASESQRQQIAETWMAHLSTSDSTAQIAIYETLGHWNKPVSSNEFEKALKSESYEVRQAVVREFLVTRAKLPVSEQISRYQKAFEVRPYQVRQEAMVDFENLSRKDRAAVSKAIGSGFAKQCKAEENADVKAECEKILKGAK